MSTDPESERHALDAALAELADNIRSSAERRVDFETTTGYTATLSFTSDEAAVLTLNQRGLTSQFLVRPDGVRFHELRGPDAEHLTDQTLVDQHLAEAWRLYDTGALSQTTQSNGNETP